MSNVVIVTDSTNDLSEKLIKENNIKVIPLYVSFGDEIYKDGVEINTDKLYDLVEKYNKIPKTSACSIGDFVTFFKKYLDQGYEVFYMGIGSKLSTTFNSALLAKEELNTDKVQVSDSANLSTGIGLSLLKASKLAREGKTAKEIKEIIDSKIVPNVRSKFAVDSLEYLHKGGRCSGVTRFFGTMARLKPVIKVEDGKLSVAAHPIGKKKALKFMIEDIVENKENIDLDCVMITHTYAESDMEYIKKALEEKIPEAHIEITNAGCVISSHCGKGTIGILYILK